MSTCGDFGGKNRDGSPCGRTSLEGRCWNHTEAAVDAETEAKAKALQAYEETLMQQRAAEAAGVSYVTLWRWRQADPEFDAAMAKLTKDAADARYTALEESMYERSIAGKAAAAESIFLLVNESRRRRDKRWQHIRQVQHSGSIGVFAAIQQLPPNEVDRILALPPEDQEAELMRLLENPQQAVGLLGPGSAEPDDEEGEG